ERDDRAKHRAVVSENVQGAHPERRPHGKRVKRNPNVIGKDLRRADLAGVVKPFPPMRAIVDYRFAEEGTDTRKLGKVRIVSRAKKRNRAEYQKDRERRGGVTPGTSK